MAIKRGRFGVFLACTGYPDCKTTPAAGGKAHASRREPDEPLDEKCPTCESGLVKKHGRFGQFIVAPAIRSASTHGPSPWASNARSATKANSCAVAAPAAADAREFSTAAHAIRTAISPRRINRFPNPCPKCGAEFIVEKKSKIGLIRTCIKEGCDWEKLVDEPAPPAKPEEVVAPVGAKS